MLMFVAQMQVLFSVQGRALEMTLNRPEALNALTTPMLYDIVAKLSAFGDTHPDSMKLVVLSGAGEKVSPA
jgi:enoyl-CoA hydratase/carnithine racemase